MSIDLSLLDADQKQAALAPRGPVAILAGAGTGKTRTITYRIAHLIEQGLVSPQRVLAVSFTKRAAGEMRQRLTNMGISGVQTRTFHSAAHKQLSHFWPQIGGSLQWQQVDKTYALVAQAAQRIGVSSEKENIKDIKTEIDWAKANLLSPNGYASYVHQHNDRTLNESVEKVAAVYAEYERLKDAGEHLLFDYNDILLHIAGAIENQPAIAEQIREQYRTFVVDEYQDVTPLQQRLLEAWLGGRDDLTVVGDPSQTIYSFGGATVRYLQEFSKKYPHAVTIKLQRDYRSTPEITGLANHVISQAKGTLAAHTLTLQGMQPTGPHPAFSRYADDYAEAQAVAQKIKDLIAQGVAAGQIAILFRTNSQTAVLEQALAEAQISYYVHNDDEFFQRPEIKQAISQLIRINMRLEQEKAQLDSDVALVDLVRNALAPVGLVAQEPQGQHARARWQTLRSLMDIIVDIVQQQPHMGLAQLLTELHNRHQRQHNPAPSGVSLATLHTAKGLEWEAVFLIGLSDGLLPMTHAITVGGEAIEEERRLLYVGITRAQKYLYCSYAKARHAGGRASRHCSRFLAHGEYGFNPQPSSAKRRGVHCRVCGVSVTTAQEKTLRRCSACMQDMPAQVHERFEQLALWRTRQAQSQNVPAYMVFSDATLWSLALENPRTEYELLSISGIGAVKLEHYGSELLALLKKL
ncbi:ATP-dependent DNA helicase UvrD2 [Corynebacterium sp. sy039]|uniref:ATP-dependent DNA helicase UvrD2 n=1 Tax=Corynebacterium sp. sy039 TaxID=2599641 RepID=UPI0011B4CDFE|nr:ATP-dependent DNA helicase UvrD2 [Corynebacterium sp. sy039]QDZ42151.1 ATP-dependent DNA helicase UvrD2 [Corynebacterium sp. sy039]